jgi:hypothetical protein
MTTSTLLFFTALAVAAIYWFRRTIGETAQTIIGDINSNTTIAEPPAAVAAVSNALLDPTVVSAQYGNKGEIVLVLSDGSVVRRKSDENAPYTPEGTLAAPPLIFGYNQKP